MGFHDYYEITADDVGLINHVAVDVRDSVMIGTSVFITTFAITLMAKVLLNLPIPPLEIIPQTFMYGCKIGLGTGELMLAAKMLSNIHKEVYRPFDNPIF